MAERRRAVAVAGHTGDQATARRGLTDVDPSVRSAALGALERLGVLQDADLVDALTDGDVGVRRRAAEIAATHRGIDLVPALHDPDPRVVEVAAWACGEHETNREGVLDRLAELAVTSDEPLVRESAVAALGAIGDARSFDAIATGTDDKPAVRRRAVLALAPFLGHDALGPRTDELLQHALEDRDWQVRQAAEDLRRAEGVVDLGTDTA